MKKLFVLPLFAIFVFTFAIDCFCEKWVNNGDTWYLYDDLNKLYKNKTYDTGNGVYYFDKDGKMQVGWWQNEKTGQVYFFNNKTGDDYGKMVFGFTSIDGYSRYFNDDGSLAHSSNEGEYKKIYLDFYADTYGNLYYNNLLVQDASRKKSDFYSNDLYYKNDELDNFYLARHSDSIEMPKPFINKNIEKELEVSRVIKNSSDNSFQGVNPESVIGGTDYYIDNKGRTKMLNDEVETIDDEEIYGPELYSTGE